MATIPIAISLATQLIPLAKPIIQQVEGWLGAKTGTAKNQLANQMLSSVAQVLAGAGKLTGNPSVEQIAAAIQSTFDAMKADGSLQESGKVQATNVSAVLSVPNLMNLGNYMISINKVG